MLAADGESGPDVCDLQWRHFLDPMEFTTCAVAVDTEDATRLGYVRDEPDQEPENDPENCTMC